MGKRTKKAKSPKKAKPIMDECEQCSGTGECQQVCEDCGVPLTEANWRPRSEAYVCNECTEIP